MSPKTVDAYGAGAGALAERAIIDSAGSTMRCEETAATATPEASPGTDTMQPVSMGGRQAAAPAVRRKTCLRISTSPPPNPEPLNPRRTPSSISATARSSSVVASKGMLFSRAELRPPPLSASRKFDSNVGFGFHSTSSEIGLGSSGGGTCNKNNGQVLSSTGKLLREAPSLGREGGSSVLPPPIRSSESFATLRKVEARRRAAWTFEPSPPSTSSPPPPSLASLGSPSSTRGTFTGTGGSYRRHRASTGGTVSTTARKTPMPPLPRMKCFASAAGAPAAAAPLAPAETSPLHTSTGTSTGDEVHKLRIAAAATPPGRLGTANGGSFKRPAPASTITAERTAAAATTTTTTAAAVPAPLSEPGGWEKARKRGTLEQRWAAWQQENEIEQENQGPPPILGKPAPPPAIPAPNRGSFGRSGSVGGGGGRGGRKGWGGVGDFHEKVAFLGDYVASVFGRSRRGLGVVNARKAQRCHDGVNAVLQFGVE